GLGEHRPSRVLDQVEGRLDRLNAETAELLPDVRAVALGHIPAAAAVAGDDRVADRISVLKEDAAPAVGGGVAADRRAGYGQHRRVAEVVDGSGVVAAAVAGVVAGEGRV